MWGPLATGPYSGAIWRYNDSTVSYNLSCYIRHRLSFFFFFFLSMRKQFIHFLKNVFCPTLFFYPVPQADLQPQIRNLGSNEIISAKGFVKGESVHNGKIDLFAC